MLFALEQEAQLSTYDERLTTLEQTIGVISAQGRDIKDIKNRINDYDQHFASLEGKLDQVLQILTTLPKTDK